MVVHSPSQKIGWQTSRRGTLVGFKENRRKKIAICFDGPTFDRLNSIAARREISFASLVRELVARGLDHK